MIHALNSKKVAVIQPVAITNNASWTVVTVDAKGYDYCEMIFQLGATDVALTVLKVQESDDNATFADVTGLVYGTSANDTGSTSTLPSATDDNKLLGFSIDTRARKRYLKLVATIGTGTLGGFAVAVAILSRAEQGPLTAADAGYSQRLVV